MYEVSDMQEQNESTPHQQTIDKDQFLSFAQKNLYWLPYGPVKRKCFQIYNLYGGIPLNEGQISISNCVGQIFGTLGGKKIKGMGVVIQAGWSEYVLTCGSICYDRKLKEYCKEMNFFISGKMYLVKKIVNNRFYQNQTDEKCQLFDYMLLKLQQTIKNGIFYNFEQQNIVQNHVTLPYYEEDQLLINKIPCKQTRHFLSYSMQTLPGTPLLVEQSKGLCLVGLCLEQKGKGIILHERMRIILGFMILADQNRGKGSISLSLVKKSFKFMNYLPEIQSASLINSLNIKSNYVGDDLKYIEPTAFSSLTELNLSENSIMDEHIIYINKFSRLSSLNLDTNFITEKGAIKIAEANLDITKLILNYNHIGDIGLHCLKTLELNHLEVVANSITSEGVICWSDSKTAFPQTYLNIGCNEIGDQGLFALGRFNHLRYLSVWDNDITQKGLRDFLQRVPNENLKVNLAGNNITVGETYDTVQNFRISLK